ncbi:MAG TPA: DUF3311 domain-containing protein [Candidatus Limnocylindrales bacterium]
MRARDAVLAILVIPFVAVLWPPFYAGSQPAWEGIPFFIWYQFLWTIITAALTIAVYFVQTRGERVHEVPAERGEAPGGRPE